MSFNPYEVFHYSSLQNFNEFYFQNILTTNHLVEEIAIKGEDEEPVHYWSVGYNKKKFLLVPELVKKLPIKINKTVPVFHSGKVYNYINSYSSVLVKSERMYTMRDMIDNYFCRFSHTNPSDYLSFNLDVFCAYVGRVNVRYSTDKSFGKTSLINIYSFLRNDASVITPASVPAVEFRLGNKLLGFDEVSNIGSEARRALQNILLTAGDMKNIYNKQTRGNGKYGTMDSYNIKDLSLLIFYNHLVDYVRAGQENKYFDSSFTDAVCDRYLPIRYTGMLDLSPFKTMPQELSQKIAEENIDLYIGILRSLQWYVNNWYTEVKHEWIKNYKFPDELKGRHLQHFIHLLQFRSIYAKDEEEFKKLADYLYQRHKDYKDMLTQKEFEKPFEEYVE